MARRDLAALSVSPDDQDEVARLILLTAGHHTDPDDRIGGLLVSIDLSILGADGAYDTYAQACGKSTLMFPIPCGGRRARGCWKAF